MTCQEKSKSLLGLQILLSVPSGGRPSLSINNSSGCNHLFSGHHQIRGTLQSTLHPLLCLVSTTPFCCRLYLPHFYTQEQEAEGLSIRLKVRIHTRTVLVWATQVDRCLRPLCLLCDCSLLGPALAGRKWHRERRG